MNYELKLCLFLAWRNFSMRDDMAAFAAALAAGARELYISACSSEETVAFYRAMGAYVTDNPIESIARDEPFDLQMVCPL